jgi:hypothetical protein
VHFTLTDLGKRLLRSRGAMNVSTEVVNANGQRISGVTTLTRFPSRGLRG